MTDYLLDGDKILQEYTYADLGYTLLPSSAADCITYYYDEAGDVIELNYYGSSYYYYKNIFGDGLGIMTSSRTMVVRYSYDAWGNILSITGTLANSLGKNNPFRYRSYYDSETGWYYLQSRYYDPAICRFISPDSQLFAGSGADGLNLYAYCGNNPVNRFDSAGEAWYHWAIGAAVVIGCATATVITCGGFAAGAMAVGMVASGGAAFSTASTVAATAFIGSATAFGTAALTAASYSDSIEEFCEYGSWWTVAETVGGAIVDRVSAYLSSRNLFPIQQTKQQNQTTINNDIIDLPRSGSALKTDPYHAFPDIVDNYAKSAIKSHIENGTLYQLSGAYRGVKGRFEWIVQNQQVTHRFFVVGGGINGIPNRP